MRFIFYNQNDESLDSVDSSKECRVIYLFIILGLTLPKLIISFISYIITKSQLILVYHKFVLSVF